MEREAKERASNRVPQECAARPAEIEEAIAALTEAELLRLESYAIWRMRGLGRSRLGRNHEDLLSEAISATLAGRRLWNRHKVDFVRYLIGVMKSIADNWNKRFNDSEPLLESEIALSMSEESARGALTDLPSVMPDQEARLLAEQQEELIKTAFENDPLVTLIICELKEGLRLREIKEKYNIQNSEYEAALKRLRRRLARLLEGGNYA